MSGGRRIRFSEDPDLFPLSSENYSRGGHREASNPVYVMPMISPDKWDKAMDEKKKKGGKGKDKQKKKGSDSSDDSDSDEDDETKKKGKGKGKEEEEEEGTSKGRGKGKGKRRRVLSTTSQPGKSW